MNPGSQQPSDLIDRARRLERDAIHADGPAWDRARQQARALRRLAAQLQGQHQGQTEAETGLSRHTQAQAQSAARQQQARELDRIRALAARLQASTGHATGGRQGQPDQHSPKDKAAPSPAARIPGLPQGESRSEASKTPGHGQTRAAKPAPWPVPGHRPAASARSSLSPLI